MTDIPPDTRTSPGPDGERETRAHPEGAETGAPGDGRAAGASGENGAGGETANGGFLTAGLPQITRVLGAIVAPTTVLTSILIYFGYSHAFWFYDYFGVESSLLGLSTQDYLLKIVDGLFVPLLVAACAGLLVLWGRSLLPPRAMSARVRRYAVPVSAALGALLALNGLSRVLVTNALNDGLAVAPLCLAGGVLLLVYAAHLWRGARRVPGHAPPPWLAVLEWAVVVLLVGLSLFWAANDYSAAVGASRARQFVEELPEYPDAVVYTARGLSLSGPGVRETRCKDPEAAYRYRYDGLKLMWRTGDQYLFLPKHWTPTSGSAIFLAKGDGLRMEFNPAPRAAPPPAC
ncbi:hypothetical protein [Bailinhaonella thermotolerans]|uniref:Uncharacterized protein n=1 Tax=Bailinhaonella thermotolerans TaxID=1070861 RepID=A0A3A4AKS2_9ACTN|nr:hypothetical protein [Bailinhaonella thermotolerans]RJL27117.1 hypothetical protein D5H75_25235 [Bailinhaonella thermotolerans]